jgi:TfoX/Sxy family transcriptional regulator of competence genes
MKRTSITRKLVSGIAMLALLLTGGLIGQSASQAAGLPTVRYVSPDFNSANETWASDGLAQYYAAGGRSYFRYVGAGSTITLTYLVTSDGTAPAADKAVSFMVNAPYSGSKATWEINGKAVGASQDSATGYGLLVAGKTDSAGKVSFTIKNTNTADSAMAIPSSETQARATTGRVYGNMKLIIDGLTDMQQVLDLLTFDITKSPAETLPAGATPTPTATATPTPSPTATATPTPTPTATATPTPTATTPATLPSMRLVSPAYGPSNSVDTTGDIAQYYSAKTRAYYTYIAAGTTVVLKYLVTSDGTKPLANKEVTLQVNAPYSGSKANWLAGTTKITVPSADSASGADLKATTNANGEVTFTIKNTDTTGLEAKPAAPNAMAPKVRLYGTLKAVIPGYGDKEADVDLVTFDIYTAPTPVAKKTTITCVKGKLTKKVTAVNPKCPTGYKKK